MTAGLSWVVVVAAEMIAGRDGLGFLIWDARNQLRPDLVVVGMIVIGIIGVIIDRTPDAADADSPACGGAMTR